MSDQKKTVTLWNGFEMPLVGLGTWQSKGDDVKKAVEWALEAGYRHIDTAFIYLNEAAVGDVLHEWISSGKIKREELFIVTKLPPIGHPPEMVEHFIKTSLSSLKLDYVDLYLVHVPVALVAQNGQMVVNGKVVLDLESDHLMLWKAMEAQVDAGRAKSIGLSNFNSQQIERIVQNARIKPANLQVELHLYFQQKRLREVCEKHGITVCAYGPLGSQGRVAYHANSGLPPPEIPAVLEDPVVVDIAKIHNKTPAQVLLRHLIQQNVIVIPKSGSQNRIRENIDVFDFVLTQSEMQRMNQLDRNIRTFDFKAFSGIENHPDYPLNIPF